MSIMTIRIDGEIKRTLEKKARGDGLSLPQLSRDLIFQYLSMKRKSEVEESPGAGYSQDRAPRSPTPLMSSSATSEGSDTNQGTYLPLH